MNLWIKLHRLYRKPYSAGITVSIIVLLLMSVLVYLSYERSNDRQTKSAQQLLSVVKENLSKTMKGAERAAYTLQMFIDEEGNVEDFEKVSASIMEHTEYIYAMQLVPDGIISQTYPQEGNEAATGLNILADDKVKSEATAAILKKDIYFAGPLDLAQGGNAVIGRLPVFRQDKFWGFVAVLILTEKIIDEMNIVSNSTQEFLFEFSKPEPNTGEKQVFFSNLDHNHPPLVESQFSESNWVVSVYANNPYYATITILPWIFIGLILSVFAGGTTFYTVNRKEKQYRTLFENSTVGIIIHDLAGNIVKTNKIVEELFGYSSEEFAKLSIYDLHGAGDKSVDLGKNLLTKIKEEGFIRVEETFKNKGGQDIECEASASIFNYAGEEHVQVIIKDLSDIRLIEKEKVLILDSITDGFLAIDPDGMITFMNKTAQDLFEFPEDYHGEVWNHLSFDDDNQLKNICEVVFETNQPNTIGVTCFRQEKWLSFSIYPTDTGLGMYFQDITTEKNLIEQKETEHFKAVKAQSQLLSSQLNPHFMFNVLNSIQYYILGQEEEAALEFLSHFSHLVRKTLSNSRRAAIPISEEITTLQTYFELEKKRVTFPLDFSIDVCDDLTFEADYLIPPMLLQPYIENSLVHAFKPDLEDCSIKVELKLEEDHLIARIVDNGVGIDERLKQKNGEKISNHKSLATAINKERIQLLNMLDLGEFRVSITDLSRRDATLHGTEVLITMPLLKEEHLVEMSTT